MYPNNMKDIPMDNLYDEMRNMRTQLLNRIEILEDEVAYLTQENHYYSRQLYQLESDIDSLLARIRTQTTHERLEFKEGSEEVNKESKETP